ncbi:MAG: DUF309 domain-containing protein [Anaerolineales bacterium]
MIATLRSTLAPRRDFVSSTRGSISRRTKRLKRRGWTRRKVRDLYRGILQVGVAYLHITRGNYDGAVKVYKRSQRWLKDWADVCRGIHVEELRRDAEDAINEVMRLGKERIGEFDAARLKPVRCGDGVE